jgi:flagellar hook protein FlgE
VQLVTEQNYAEANVKSIKTADEVLGSVIDIRV